MKIENRIVGDVHLLDCSGKITLGEGTMAIRNAVREDWTRLWAAAADSVDNYDRRRGRNPPGGQLPVLGHVRP